MRSPLLRSAALVAALAPAARRAPAQTPQIHVGGSLQEQFSTVRGDSSAAFTPGASRALFEARRMRLVADVRFGDNVTMQLGEDFAAEQLRMLTAWVRVLLAHDATSGLGLTVGQERKPFNRYELTSSNTLVAIERGARLRGLPRPAVQDNLLAANGYVQLDMGASLDAYLLRGRMTLKAGLYNGSGEGTPDGNNAKTFVGRGTLTAASDDRGRPLLRFGAAVSSRDRAVIEDSTCTSGCAFAPDSSRRSTAYGIEAEWGDFRPGLHVMVDASTGEQLPAGHWTYDTGRNLGNLRPGAPDSAFTTFRALQVVASWRWQRPDRAGGLVRIIEPAVRLDLTDPDIARSGDAGMLVTGAVSLHFSPTALVRAGYDWYRYTDAAGARRSISGARVSWQVAF